MRILASVVVEAVGRDGVELILRHGSRRIRIVHGKQLKWRAGEDG